MAVAIALGLSAGRQTPLTALHLQIPSTTLPLAVRLEGDIRGATIRRYEVPLNVGEYAHAVVDQGTSDLAISVRGPADDTLIEYDARWHGPEPVSIIARTTGVHYIEIRSVLPATTDRHYEIELRERRASVAGDTRIIEIEHVATRAKQLLTQGTAESLREARTLYEQALPAWRELGDHFGEAQTLNSLGYILNILGDNYKSFETYRDAVAAWRVAGSITGEAEALSNMAGVHSALGDKREALTLYEKALVLRRSAEDRLGEAFTLNNIGVVYSHLGEPDKAIEYHGQALPLFEAAGEHVLVAATIQNIAAAYMFLGEAQEALDRYAKALPVLRSVKNFRLEAAALNNMGALYKSLGEHQRALLLVEEALVSARRSGDARVEATVLTQIGGVYRILGDSPQALKHYAQALKIWESVGDRRGKGSALFEMAELYAASKDSVGARGMYERALPLLEAAGDRRTLAAALSGFALLLARGSEVTASIARLEDALRLARETRDQSVEASALLNLAIVLRDSGDLIAARRRLETALLIIESARTRVFNPELRTSYFASKQRLYDHYIDVLMRLHEREPTAGHAAVAFGASERARARLLLELLVEARADIRQGVDADVTARERVLQQRLNGKAEREVALRSGRASQAEIAALTKEIEDLLAEYQDVQAQIRAKSPRYAALTQPRPLGAADIQALLDDETVLLEYWLGEDRSLVWVVTHESVEALNLKPKAEIEAAADRAYRALSARRLGENTDLSSSLARLSDAVLPLVGRPLTATRIVVVASGILQYVPFGALALPTSSGQRLPLVVNHDIVSLPSASALVELRADSSTPRRSGRTVSVIADPVFSSDDPRVLRALGHRTASPAAGSRQPEATASALERSARESGATSDGAHLPRLPFSRREADAIAQLIPAKTALKAVDFAASRTTVTRADVADSRILHFATHGLLNTIHPELSGIVLSLVNERGEPQDGFLRLHDIYNLRLSADLVVLSACQSGLGKNSKGEGLIGLTRGFMYAGAPRVVVSLWKVDDEATAELMKRFYERMLGQERLPPAAALNAAQRQLSRHPRWRSPYYWAGFVLQGDWR